MRVPLVLLVLLLQASSFAEQAAVSRTAAQPLAAIRGRVLTADADALPVRRARIAVAAGGTSSFPVFTDDEGRFELGVPVSGSYTVTVRKAGFVRLSAVRAGVAAGDTLDVRLARAAVLSGRVVDPAGRPVSDVAVRAQHMNAPERASTPVADLIGETNDSGEFRIHGVAAGRYRLHTQPVIDAFQDLDSIAPQIRQKALDQLTTALTPLSLPVLADAIGGQETIAVLQHSAPATLGISVGGALTGLVSDERGEPLDGISVAVWKVEFDGGRRQATPAARSRLTDDRGVFRLFHVPPGRYVVVATDGRWRPDSPEPSAYLPVFYPGRTTIAEAIEVEVVGSQSPGGIDVNISMPFSWTRGVKVHGLVASTASAPRDRLVTLARSFRSGGIAPPDRTVPTLADGSFEFPNVATGEYVIRVTGTQAPRLAGSTAPAEYAMQYVGVGPADAGPIVVTTTPMSTISGYVRVEGNAKALQPTGLTLLAIPSDPDSAPTMANGPGATIRADWTFELSNLAGSIRIALELPSEGQGWWIKSVDVGGANAALEPVTFGRPGDSRDDVTIVLSTAVGALSGRVFDGTLPADDCWVFVFAVDENRWFSGSPYLRRASLAQNARFSVPSLPPGDYWVVATDDDVSGTWLNPDVLNGLVPDARKVTIVEGREPVVDLRLVRLLQ